MEVRPPLQKRRDPTTGAPPRKRLRLILTICASALFCAVGIFIFGLHCRPNWYIPRSIDYGTLEDDKRAQVQLENRVSAALSAGQSVELTLTQDQLNRWIAARGELWPGKLPSLEPFEHPMIVLEEGNRIRVAASAVYAGVRAVISLTFRVELTEGEVVIAADSLHAGALPIPTGVFAKNLRNRMERAPTQVLEFDGERLVLRNEWVWPNGKRLFRAAALWTADGALRITLEPLE